MRIDPGVFLPSSVLCARPDWGEGGGGVMTHNLHVIAKFWEKLLSQLRFWHRAPIYKVFKVLDLKIPLTLTTIVIVTVLVVAVIPPPPLSYLTCTIEMTGRRYSVYKHKHADYSSLYFTVQRLTPNITAWSQHDKLSGDVRVSSDWVLPIACQPWTALAWTTTTRGCLTGHRFSLSRSDPSHITLDWWGDHLSQQPTWSLSSSSSALSTWVWAMETTAIGVNQGTSWASIETDQSGCIIEPSDQSGSLNGRKIFSQENTIWSSRLSVPSGRSNEIYWRQN